MAIDSNVLLKAIVPDAIGAAQKGFNLGTSIRNAPLLRQQNEQLIQQNEQKLAAGNAEAGETESIATYSLMQENPITADNYLATVTQLKRAGLPLQDDDFELTEENIKWLEGLRKMGKVKASLIGKGGLASATTTTWKNGTTLFNLPNGAQRLVFQGREITDPIEFAERIKDANSSGLALAGEEAFTRAAKGAEGEAVGSQEVIDITTGNISAEKQAEIRAQTQEKRQQATIESGLSAAPQLKDINRGLELIDKVDQGGYAAVKKEVTDFFGTTSSDTGELNRTLASTVLQGLSAFTGAISEGERAFVEKMSASLKSGADVNKAQLQRLKGIYEGQVRKAASIAKRNEDFTTLESLKVDLGDSELGKELFPKSAGKQQEKAPIDDKAKRLQELRAKQ